MVEIFNIERTKSLGCFVNFKSAKGTLNGLIASGELSGENPAVLVCCYKTMKCNVNISLLITENGMYRHLPKRLTSHKKSKGFAVRSKINVAKSMNCRWTALQKRFLTG